MFIAHHPEQLDATPRAVALGTFDGVHVGHRELIARVVDGDLRATVVTFHPHPRLVVGRGVELVSSLERRLELLATTGVEDVLVAEFTSAVAKLSPEAWAASVLAPIGARRVVIGENFRFGHRRAGDAETLAAMDYDVVALPLLYGASSSLVRDRVRAGDLRAAAQHLGRPFELEGTIVEADGTKGRSRLTLRIAENMVLPPDGAYPGELLGHRARVVVQAGALVQVVTAHPDAGRPGARVRVALEGRPTRGGSEQASVGDRLRRRLPPLRPALTS